MDFVDGGSRGGFLYRFVGRLHRGRDARQLDIPVALDRRGLDDLVGFDPGDDLRLFGSARRQRRSVRPEQIGPPV